MDGMLVWVWEKKTFIIFLDELIRISPLLQRGEVHISLVVHGFFLGHLYRNNQLYGSSRSILPGPFLRIQIQWCLFKGTKFQPFTRRKSSLKDIPALQGWVNGGWMYPMESKDSASLRAFICVPSRMEEVIYIVDPLGSEIN